MQTSLILLATLACFASQIYCASISKNPKLAALKNFKSITSGEVYDKDVQPRLGEDEPVQINITMHLIDYKFDAFKREMTVSMYFRQMWSDPRLESKTMTADAIGGQSLVNRVWLPDTFFSNSLSVDVFKYPTRNSFLKVKPNGDVMNSEKILVTFRCGPPPSAESNDLDKCSLEMESYGHSMADILYNLPKGPASMSGAPSTNEHNQYKLTSIETVGDSVTLSSGEYGRVSVHFNLAKK